MAVVGVLVGLALLGGYAAWLHRRLAVAPRWAPAVRRAVLVTVVAGVAVFVAAALLLRRGDPATVRPVVWLGMTEVAFALYLTVGLALLALAALGLRLAGRPETRLRLLRFGTPAVVALSLAVTAYGVVVALRPGVTTHELRSEALPAAFDGTRVALVTDLHVGPLHDASWTQRMVDLVAEQDPDLVVLGGDFVDGDPTHVAPYLEPLRDLNAPLGVYLVTGNHEMIRGEREAAEWVAVFESLGIDVLDNESVEIERGGARIVVAGVHDESGTGALAPDPDAALAGVDPDDFLVYAAHKPRQLEPDAGVDLQLSGHTHGGQLWPIGQLVPFGDPTLAGLDVVDGVPIVTSRGIGTSGPPVRVGSPSRIDVVVLRSVGDPVSAAGAGRSRSPRARSSRSA